MPDLPTDWLQRLMLMLSGQQSGPSVQGGPTGGMDDQLRQRFAGAFRQRHQAPVPTMPPAGDGPRIQPVPSGDANRIPPVTPTPRPDVPKLPTVPTGGDQHIQPIATPAAPTYRSNDLYADGDPRRRREVM